MSDTEKSDFVKVKNRPKNLRKRNVPANQNSAVDQSILQEVEDRNELQLISEVRKSQKNRRKQNGMSASVLAFGVAAPSLEQIGGADIFKLSAGGLIDADDLKGQMSLEADEISKKLSNNFSAEMKQRDEDRLMLNYIEQQLAFRMKSSEQKFSDKANQNSKLEKESYESRLQKIYEIPEYLKNHKTVKNEEMLSNQILTGIPEVDLGLEAKFRNIEATETALKKLIQEKNNEKETDPSQVPANMAVNFTQNHRYLREDASASKSQSYTTNKPEQITSLVPVVGNSGPELKVLPSNNEIKEECSKRQRDIKSTDDIHYEKFTKKSRRY